MVTVNTSDLEFILQQIKIAEADARGEQILGALIPTSELPWGLRRVDGSNNHLVPGQESYGAADQQFPRATTPVWVAEGDDGMSFGPPRLDANNVPIPSGVPGIPAGYTAATYLTNNDYAVHIANNPALSSRGIQPGDVVDADPRIISNLIVDQTMNNPAVLISAFHSIGSADSYADAALIQAKYDAYKAFVTGGDTVSADSLKAEILVDLAAAGLTYEASPNGDLAKLTVVVANVAPDEGLSAPFNSWMTIFGQFFDHGLDSTAKGGFGTVYIPLQPDDPLYVPGSNTNFMVVTRATLNENGEPINKVTPYVDQNQTYTSHASHQVFLREYELVDGKPVATGRLLNGNDASGGGLATWADVKAQALNILGIELNDLNVHDVPLLATDAYGNFIRGANGFPQIVTLVNGAQVLVEGNTADPVSTVGAVSTGHTFLDDISRNADPVGGKTADVDTDVSTALQRQPVGTYDNELLDLHYIGGDGRANENIALTAVHHVFHSEHNRQIDSMKAIMIANANSILTATGDIAAATEFLNEWLMVPVTTAEQLALPADLAWNGERMFQSAKFVTEMQYQHLVFEEFARKVQPFVNLFVSFDGQLDPAILGEFAHTVYRFGHSMLNEGVDRYDANYNADHIDLISAFLNPVEYAASGINADEAAGALARGMTRQRGNEIDEFVTEALRNNLVGLPLDLAAINIARGRELGVPSLNESRAQFFAGSADAQIKPYTSWYDFALNIKNPASIINFIAAYGTHETITTATTLEAKRDAATLLVLGSQPNGPAAPADRVDFLMGQGAYAGGDLGGLNNVDLWIGGLAEKKMVFGGMLGSTFNFIFEVQLEALQDADRFYYLSRLANLNLTAQMENNKFSEMIHRNSSATHLPGDVFSTPDFYIEADKSKQFNAGLLNEDPTLGGDMMLSAMMPKVIRIDANADGVAESVRFVGAEHVVLGGTDGNDILIGGKGDDTFWGDAGNDRLEGGEGNDFFFGGDGNDIITDEFGDDEIRSGAGDDVVTAGQGLNLIITDTGSDFIWGGADVDDILAGQDNDFAHGSVGGGMIMGGEGDDWLEAGGSNNLILGDNGDLVQGLPIKRSVDSTIVGHDVLIGGNGNDDFDAETGDDIMIGGAGTNKFFGQLGFDWASHASTNPGVTADMMNLLFTPPSVAASPATVLERYAQTESLSGSRNADILRGDDEVGFGVDHGLLDRNVSLINGLDELLGGVNEEGDLRFSSGNILLGGGGSDLIEGRGGNDLIDGDRFLNAKIKVTPTNGDAPYFVSGMTEIQAKMFTGEITSSQLSIVREIIDGSVAGDVDVAEFSGKLADYTIEGFDVDTGIATDQDLDGWISITDNRAAGVLGGGVVNDGMDRVKNVERVLFADGGLKIAQHANRMAEGRVSLEANGQAVLDGQQVGVAGQVLRASMIGVTDRDNRGVGNLTGTISAGVEYTWQVEVVAGSGVFRDITRIVADNFSPMTGETYTVSAAETGLAIRAVARFLDNKGAVETVYSNANEGGNPEEPIPATGAPIISDTTPTENQVLTADTSTIADENGLGVFAYQWQTSVDGTIWTNVGTNSASFTPTQAQVGQQIQVQVSFTDGFGTLETLTSAPTAIVADSNVLPTGVPTINDTTPAVGQTLTANSLGIDDANGFNIFTPRTYQWEVQNADTTWSVIAGATSASFTTTAAQVGAALRVSVSFTDGEGTLEKVYSAATSPVGNTITGTNAANTLTGTAGGDVITGLQGNDTINAGDGDDEIVWNANNALFGNVTDGSDFVDGGAGIDTMDVNTRTLSAETFRIYTRAAAVAANIAITNANTEIVIMRGQAPLFGATTYVKILELDNIEEIVIGTNNVTGAPGGAPGATPNAGGAGAGDTVQIFGDFRQTSLLLNTITINGTAADDMVDITALESAHRIVFRTAGGNDMVVGTLRAQDVIELPVGAVPADYVPTDNGDGTVTLASETHSVVFTGTVDALPTLAPAPTPAPVDPTLPVEPTPVDPNAPAPIDFGAATLTASDVANLTNLVRGIPSVIEDNGNEGVAGYRDLAGMENNLALPGQGAAGQPFLRLTDARYGALDQTTGNLAVNTMFDRLDPRAISNIIGTQGAEVAPAADINTFFMAFGQYFDHGLSFIPKGGNGSVQIGAPGASRPGSVVTDNPADLTRASVAGWDANGVPQHTNITSPFVDQNQVYGSSNLVGQLLRATDGNNGVGAHLVRGDIDPSNTAFTLLPNLRQILDHHIEAGTIFTGPFLPEGGQTLLEFYPGLIVDGAYDPLVVKALVSNFMGEGYPLLLDANPFINLLDHVIAGDGRANENITLTSMHEIWSRNHEFHVANLEAAGFVGTPEELFQAAKIVNEAEYQRVVFTEFAEKLLGGVGIRGTGDHGFSGYNPETDAGISHEFAAAVYRVGHTMVGENVDILNADGTTRSMTLFDAFLNPTSDEGAFTMPLSTLAQFGYVPQPGYEQIGAGAILGGIVGQAGEAVDVHMVDAIRNDLVRISADLFSFNVARGRDLGLGTLNQVRTGLDTSASSYVREAVGYVGGLTAYTSWEDFQTRNSLSDTMIEAFKLAYPDLVLDTPEAIAAFVASNPDITLIDNGDGSFTVKGIDRVDLWVGGLAEAKFEGAQVGSTFWVVLHEQLDRLQEGDRFYYIDRLENFDLYANFVEGEGFAAIVARNTGLTGLDERIFEVSNEDNVAVALPVVDAPVVDAPVVDAPVVDAPVVDAPVVDAPVVDAPVVDAPVVDAPVVDAPVVDAPVVDAPVVDAPVVDAPVVDAPVVDAPVVDAPVVDTPVVTPPVVETPVVPVDTVPVAPVRYFGTSAADTALGGAGADIMLGRGGDDALIGEGGNDVLRGEDGDDFLSGDAGRDMIFGGTGNDDILAGQDADMVYGDDGQDRLFGNEGDDILNGGLGDDTLHGDEGDDLFVASEGDGDDVYDGGIGTDTLDMSAILANITVDLGIGLMGRGASTGTGYDSLNGIENVVTGRGADTIMANAAVNVLDGGEGDNTFVFRSVADARGDTILGFNAGDVIDLSGINANSPTGAFTLVGRGMEAGAGELAFSHLTENGHDMTMITGNTGTDAFALKVQGHHELTNDQFSL